MISVEAALDHVTAAFEPVAAETVSLAEALGRVLAEDVTARRTQPPFDVSAMDGYAVRAGETAAAPVRLPVSAEFTAGAAPGVLTPATAARIFTGAPVPAGADTIVIQEHTTRDGDHVQIKQPATSGAHIRTAGYDFRQGDRPLAAGRRLTARDIGLIAAMDVSWLKVRRRPRIALLATGNELVLPGAADSPNHIVNANAFLLGAYVRTWGALPLDLGIAPDDEAALGAMIAAAEGADLLVTVGGASVGDRDLVRPVLRAAGFAALFEKVAMRPGKPAFFGWLGRLAVLGLPGNPVSAAVTARVFLAPAIAAMLGTESRAPLWMARLDGQPLRANDQRQNYVRARLRPGPDGMPLVQPFTRQDSAELTLYAKADALIVRPPSAPAAIPGDTVPVLSLQDNVARS